jgi:hypothetical protein
LFRTHYFVIQVVKILGSTISFHLPLGLTKNFLYDSVGEECGTNLVGGVSNCRCGTAFLAFGVVSDCVTKDELSGDGFPFGFSSTPPDVANVHVAWFVTSATFGFGKSFIWASACLDTDNLDGFRF